MTRTTRPRVLVTGPDRGGLAAWAFTRLAIARAGGRPTRATPKRKLPDEWHALVIGGGADVGGAPYAPAAEPPPEHDDSPTRRYLPRVIAGLRTVASTRRPRLDGARDELELSLLRDALRRGIPVLGICRGSQLINVAAGGSLHRQLDAFHTETPAVRSVRPAKCVHIEPNSLLRSVVGVSSLRVNSLHRQAVAVPGTRVRVAAREPNGVVQAIELAHRPFAIGVQWHPEYLPDRRAHQRLFRALVRAARTGSGVDQADDVAFGVAEQRDAPAARQHRRLEHHLTAQ